MRRGKGDWWPQALPAALALALVAGAPPRVPAGMVVPAEAAKPGDLPTYAGPDGKPIPVGACPELVSGNVWVVPCSASGAQAYRRPGQGPVSRGAAAVAAEATAGAWGVMVVGGVLVTVISRRRGKEHR